MFNGVVWVKVQILVGMSRFPVYLIKEAVHIRKEGYVCSFELASVVTGDVTKSSSLLISTVLHQVHAIWEFVHIARFSDRCFSVKSVMSAKAFFLLLTGRDLKVATSNLDSPVVSDTSLCSEAVPFVQVQCILTKYSKMYHCITYTTFTTVHVWTHKPVFDRRWFSLAAVRYSCSLLCARYTLLVGKPPFETSCLKDTYSKIKKNEYHIPVSRMSPPAKRLIERLLQAEPVQRPTMEQVLHDEFFTTGLSIHSLSCHS